MDSSKDSGGPSWHTGVLENIARGARLVIETASHLAGPATGRPRPREESLTTALAAAELARKEAEAANGAKDRLLAVLGHELRAPLTPVLMAATHLGKDEKLPAHVRDAMRMIQRNIQMEARLIEDLLDLTRLARDKMELHVEPMDLHSAVREALEICQEEIGTKKHRVQADLAAIDSRITGDPGRLRQVFWNIIRNAVKFTREGGEIRIRSRNDGPRILVEITASGIPSSVLPWIFNPLEQDDEGLLREFGGLGLGLAVSQAVISAHHGILEAFGDGQNPGVTFVVGLTSDGS